MKTFYKVLISLLVGICFILAGISIGGLDQIDGNSFLSGLDFRWNARTIDDAFYQATQSINDLDIDVHNANIDFIETDGDHIEVKATSIYDGFKVYQSGNTLIVKQPNYWNLFKRYASASIRIYVPKDMIFENIKVNGSAGTMKINNLKCEIADFNIGVASVKVDNMECEDMNFKLAAGNVKATNITCNNELSIDAGMGNINVDLVGSEKEYNYKINVGMGNVRVGSEHVAGFGSNKSHSGLTDKMINVKCGMGNVKVTMEG